MKTIEEIREVAKTKLVGYTDKEIEIFVQAAIFMAGHLPQKRSEEWYQKREEERTHAKERSEQVCKLFQDVTGLKKAVDNLNHKPTQDEIIERAFSILFENMVVNAEFRATMLDRLAAEEKMVSSEIIEAVKIGCKAFNESHDIQLGFEQMEENEGRWTFFWDEKI